MSAFCRSSSPTLGPTASARTTVYLPAPSTRSRAVSTSARGGAGVLAAGPRFLASRARMTTSRSMPKFWISAPRMSCASRAERTAPTSTGCWAFDLQQRAAGEFDPVVQPADSEEDQPGQEDRSGDEVSVCAGFPMKSNFGVRQETTHVRYSAWRSPAGAGATP